MTPINIPVVLYSYVWHAIIYGSSAEHKSRYLRSMGQGSLNCCWLFPPCFSILYYIIYIMLYNYIILYTIYTIHIIYIYVIEYNTVYIQYTYCFWSWLILIIIATRKQKTHSWSRSQAPAASIHEQDHEGTRNHGDLMVI